MKNRNSQILPLLAVIWGFLFFFLAFPLFCQETTFSAIDKHARSAKGDWDNVTDLVRYLVAPAADTLQQFRSFYFWVANFIDYDLDAYHNGNKRINKNNRDILTRRKAVCFGYANLLKEMCDIAGIPCEIISGYSKGTLTSTRDRFEIDHAWNAVFLEGKWHLVDATWGSSALKKSQSFILENTPFYFLSNPDIFILNHLPGDPKWQLLDCPIPFDLFNSTDSDIKTYIDSTESCFNFKDSITQWLLLPYEERVVQTAYNTYRFNPSSANSVEYGHTLVDFAGRILDRAASLDALEQIIPLQTQAIEHLLLAEKFISLLDWQLEMLVSALVNVNIALYNQTLEMNEATAISENKAKARLFLAMIQEKINTLKPGTFRELISKSYKDLLKLFE